MRLKVLLPIVADTYKKYTDKYPTKTILLKLCYLADIEYISRTGERLLEEEWVYYHYGPYIFSYNKELSSPEMEVETGTSKAGHNYEVIKTTEQYVPQKLEFDIKQSVNHVVFSFKDKDLDEILDFVYFDTEPMLSVRERGDTLDMTTVLPAEAYRVKRRTISSRNLSKFRKKYREKGKKLNAG